MATHASLLFTLLLCACVHTVVECDSSCSNKLECTIYKIQEVGRKVDNMQSNMAAMVNQLNQVQNQPVQLSDLQSKLNNQTEIITELAEKLQNQSDIMAEQAKINTEQAKVIKEQAKVITEQAKVNTEQAIINTEQAKVNTEQANVNAEQGNTNGILQLESMVQGQLIAEHTMSITEQGEQIINIELENQRQQSNYVAFTASASETRKYNQGDHVLFDSVLINYGHSYNGENSTFICSHNAYYLFSISVRTDDGTKMRAQIQLDITPLVSVYTYDGQTGSKLVVTYCGEGQRVWVMCHSGSGNVMIGNSRRISVFVGTLLRLA